ncbi:ATP-grasp domain-containing protein [Nesterenkonia massiliensis]|uniref:ATP-binding protein n=1 Tax=Nesterenkonia massiliensis TaxID=1232429 RepID=UPI0003FC9A58|nr:ATP-grasp domain-containing protein [Nesterenkonia massiliensis]
MEKKVRFDDSRPASITRREDYRKLIRKWDTKRLLEEAGVPVPRGRLIQASDTSMEDLQTIAHAIGYPLVIKPNNGTMGRGVFSGISDWEQLVGSWKHLVEELKADQILIEQHYQGDDYRILVVGDEVAAACLRIPANIEGDGDHTVQELIVAKNELRSQNPFLSKGLIKVDFEVRQELKNQGLSLESVPKTGERVVLRRVANASAGGDVVDVTSDLPEEIKRAAVEAVAAIPNIVIAGVDVLYQTGMPASPETFTVIEMNSRPHIPVNMYPTHGEGQDVPRTMMDHFFPDSSRLDRPGDELLNFDPRPFRPPLRAGAVGSMTVKPLPSHHYPVRRRFDFAAGVAASPLNESIKLKLQKRARALGVVGSLQHRDEVLSMVSACADLETSDKWLQEVQRLLDLEFSGSEEWLGVVTTGFWIPKALLEETA